MSKPPTFLGERVGPKEEHKNHLGIKLEEELEEELVPYKNWELHPVDYEALMKLNEFLKDEPEEGEAGDSPYYDVSVKDHRITGLYIYGKELMSIPKEISKLTELKYLELDNNQIEEIKGLNNNTKLETIYLANNQITEIKELKTIKELKYLFLKGNPIRMDDPEIKELEKRGVIVSV